MWAEIQKAILIVPDIHPVMVLNFFYMKIQNEDQDNLAGEKLKPE